MHCVDLEGAIRAGCCCQCGRVWPQLIEHQVLRLLAVLVQLFLFAFFFAGAFGLKRIEHQVRYSVYLLYWYKSTNTDASIKDSIKEGLRKRSLPLATPSMPAYADVCGRMLTYADVCGRMLTYAASRIASGNRGC
jgi:hypothetical protein